MSFKRDGDDQTWLNLLQKRRISELFAVDIPDDEALLMKNGRFACLVCHHRPVFDTVATLAVHRNGKKHAIESEKFVANKKDLEELVLKRRHEQYMNCGERVPAANNNTRCSSSESRSSASHRLLSACMYDSRARRRHVGPYGRRQVVSLDESTASSSSASSDADQTSRSHWQSDEKPAQTIADIRKQMKRLKAEQNPAPLKPYVGKRCSTSIVSFLDTGLAANVNSHKSVIAGSSCQTAVSTSTDCSQRLTDSEPNKKSGQAPVYDDPLKLYGYPTMLTAEKKEKIAQYFSAVGSGWKRSRDGTWIKDADAEFDSDDEPPDSI